MASASASIDSISKLLVGSSWIQETFRNILQIRLFNFARKCCVWSPWWGRRVGCKRGLQTPLAPSAHQTSPWWGWCERNSEDRSFPASCDCLGDLCWTCSTTVHQTVHLTKELWRKVFIPSSIPRATQARSADRPNADHNDQSAVDGSYASLQNSENIETF